MNPSPLPDPIAVGAGLPTKHRADASLPIQAKRFPQLRFMGSKHRLLPWIHEVTRELPFDSALDGFSGSGCVSYLFKSMGKRVVSNDFLRFSATVARATVENSRKRLGAADLELLLAYDPKHPHFIEKTFSGIFFTPEDLRFLDRISWNLKKLRSEQLRALALSALFRSCVKRQPRGVFTVAGDPEKYKDGRRDLQLSIRQHFLEQVEAYNQVVFDNGERNRAVCGSVFDAPKNVDLVYMDPPYVPRADDNCYVKRYHFLEGLSQYWEGLEILTRTKVRKIAKPYTPFSYRKSARSAFDAMFDRFQASTLVLSYSSNGYPDLDELVSMMRQYKGRVVVHERAHRYHFGTHAAVSDARKRVLEYLIVGSDAAC